MSTSSQRTADPTGTRVSPPVTAGPEAAPVFVDQSGVRGRRLRHLGWFVGAGALLFTVGLVVSLFGAGAQAPPLKLPDSLRSPAAAGPVPQAPAVSPSALPSTSGSASGRSSAKPGAGHSGSPSARPGGSASRGAAATTAKSTATTAKTGATRSPGTAQTSAGAKPSTATAAAH